MYKMKKGGSFPDLNKDGKITKVDILKGRGVIAKKGTAVKKAQKGIRVAPGAKTAPGMKMKFGESRKNYEKRIADATSSYEGSTAPKVEYKVPSQPPKKAPGVYRSSNPGGQTVSVDTVGMAAGKRSFPAKVTSKSGKTSYYPINRGSAKTAVKFSQKNGGKTMKKCKYGCK